MTTVREQRSADDEVLTPTVRRFFRRSLFWIAIATIILLIAVVGLVFSGAVTASQDPLSTTNPAPEGAKALAEVLRHEGVEVTATATLQATARAIDDPADTTLLLYDRDGILTAEQYEKAADLADTIVLLDANDTALRALAPDISPAAEVSGDVTAGCSVDSAEQAETITGDGSGYSTTDSDAVTCFSSGDEVYSLVQAQRGGATITVVGATEALSNGRILENGNAALALGLLGSQNELVWYVPGIADITDAPPTAAELSPAWVVPTMLMLVLVFIAAALWRGRRFGPIIVENLPVTVRASETMQGRARLYQHSSARLHALDSLRIGTIDRLARVVGLPTLATTDDVIRSISHIVDRDEREIRMLLVDAVPSTDRDLIALSDQLLTLEALVTRRLRPE